MVTRVPSEDGKPTPPPARTQTAPGSRAASVPPATAGATTTTMETKPTPWNADMSPLYLGRLGQQGSGLGGAIGPNQRAQTTVYDVSTEWLTSLKANDQQGYNLLVDNLRAGGFLGAKAKSVTSIKEAFQMAAKEAAARVDAGQQTNIDLMEYIASKANAGLGGAGTAGSRSAGYSGPVSTVTQLAEPDVRLVADQIASTVLGRAVTEQEFKTVLQTVRGLEQANPSVSGAGVASQTNVSGLSQAAREDVITRALLKQDGAEEFTLATKMMGLYRKALQEMPNG